MAAELDSLVHGSEIEARPNPRCLFLSGGMGTYARIQGIKEGLEKAYGLDQIQVFNSIFSTDRQNPERFIQIADFIQSHAKEGLDIVAHSLGAAELRRAIEIVSKRDKTFFDKKENTEKLNIVLIGPSGFAKNIQGSFRFLARTIRYAREQADLGRISKSNTLFRGIDALTVFPPKNVSSEDLARALREAMPELSHYREDVPSITLQKEENYFDKLTVDQKEQAAIYGAMIRNAIENRNYSGLASIIRAYGEKLRRPLAQVYAGRFEETTKLIQVKTRATMGGYIGLLSVLIEGFGSKPMKEIAKLKNKGVRVDFIIPEYDIFVPLNEAIAFFEGREKALKHIKIAEGVAHAYPALQKMRFGEMIRNLR